MTVVEEIIKRLDSRLAELEPLMAEYQELLAVKEGFASRPGTSSRAATSPATGRARAATRSSHRHTAGGRGPGRAEQAIALVTASPGITVKEIAAHMGINENYLYRLLPRMEKEGRLKRQGKGWAAG